MLINVSDIIWYHVNARRCCMTQVSARLTDDLVKGIDEAAKRMHRSRADVIRLAIEYYLDDIEDLRLAMDRLKDPADPILDWDEVKRELLAED
jgi:transposase